MCTTREEIRSIVHDEMYESYNSVASQLSEMGVQVKEMRDTFRKHTKAEEAYQERVDAHLNASSDALINLSNLTKEDIAALKEVAQGYAGMATIKKLIIGISSVFLAVGTIVMGFIHIIRSIK